MNTKLNKSLEEFPIATNKTELNGKDDENNESEKEEFHSILSYSSSVFSSPYAFSIDSFVATSVEDGQDGGDLDLKSTASSCGLSGRTFVVHLPFEEQIERDSATEEQLARIRREIEELELDVNDKDKIELLRRRKSRRDLVKVPLESGLPVALHSKETGKETDADFEGLDSDADDAATEDTPRDTAPGSQYVGMKIVDEDHRNYILMYDMLTGIRISVSRCQAKPGRPLTPRDFYSSHKMAFDLTGNEETPSSRYDFKFKDYSPWVFRSLREKFGIDAADYLVSEYVDKTTNIACRYRWLVSMSCRSCTHPERVAVSSITLKTTASSSKLSANPNTSSYAKYSLTTTNTLPTILIPCW